MNVILFKRANFRQYLFSCGKILILQLLQRVNHHLLLRKECSQL